MDTKATHRRRRPRLTWTEHRPTQGELRNDEYTTLDHRAIHEAVVTALDVTPEDRGLAPLLDFDQWFPPAGRVAVLDIPINTPADVWLVTRCIVEPAFLAGCDLLVHADRSVVDIDFAAATDDDGLCITAERLHYLLERYHVTQQDNEPPLTPIEAQLLAAMRALDLRPEIQYGVDRFRLDFAFPAQRLAVEADGREWHDEVRDRQRDERLGARGWTVLHFSGSRIHNDADGCARDVETNLRSLQRTYDFTPPDVAAVRDTWWRRLITWIKSLFVAEAPHTELAAEPTGRYVTGRTTNHGQRLDAEQLSAVSTGDGVTQVVAPAGSGKTTVLVERVLELLSRGVPANRILCTTFNKAAVEELRTRLDIAGASSLVSVKTFHGTGLAILKEEGMLPENLFQATHGELRKIAGNVAQKDNRTFIDAGDAREAISRFKLERLRRPEELEYFRGPGSMADFQRFNSELDIYHAYERLRAERDGWDYDDLVFQAYRLLRDDPATRNRWSARWWCVLVDEFQDIEPAQELLVRLLASPQDCLFLVGDEDQCIYSWRRAAVTRMVELDKTFPSLTRVLLRLNYRSGSSLVSSGRQLIANNKVRFQKEIVAARDDRGTIELVENTDDESEWEHLASWLAEQGDFGEVVVLARTRRQLQSAAQWLLEHGFPLDIDKDLLRATTADKVVLAYLLVTHDPHHAMDEHVEMMFWHPNRYLEQRHVHTLRSGRRGGHSFEQVVATLPRMAQWRRDALNTAAPKLDRLATEERGADAMDLLRGELGLDRHFSSRDQMRATENEDCDALDALTALAEGSSTKELLDALRNRLENLEEHRTKAGARRRGAEGAVEMSTIHGAKGREWSKVALIGAGQEHMPNMRAALTGTQDERAVMEDERRLAYVAITRAKDDLRISWTPPRSTFVTEALGDTIKVAEPTTAELPDERGASRRPQPSAGRLPANNTSRKGQSTRPPRVVKPGRAIRAKYGSGCPNCGSSILAGQLIVRGSTGWVHQDCA